MSVDVYADMWVRSMLTWHDDKWVHEMLTCGTHPFADMWDPPDCLRDPPVPDVRVQRLLGRHNLCHIFVTAFISKQLKKHSKLNISNAFNITNELYSSDDTST